LHTSAAPRQRHLLVGCTAIRRGASRRTADALPPCWPTCAGGAGGWRALPPRANHNAWHSHACDSAERTGRLKTSRRLAFLQATFFYTLPLLPRNDMPPSFSLARRVWLSLQPLSYSDCRIRLARRASQVGGRMSTDGADGAISTARLTLGGGFTLRLATPRRFAQFFPCLTPHTAVRSAACRFSPRSSSAHDNFPKKNIAYTRVSGSIKFCCRMGCLGLRTLAVDRSALPPARLRISYSYQFRLTSLSHRMPSWRCA